MFRVNNLEINKVSYGESRDEGDWKGVLAFLNNKN